MATAIRFNALNIMNAQNSGDLPRAAVLWHTVTGVCVCVCVCGGGGVDEYIC